MVNMSKLNFWLKYGLDQSFKVRKYQLGGNKLTGLPTHYRSDNSFWFWIFIIQDIRVVFTVANWNQEAKLGSLVVF